jgi:ribonuclease HI
VKKLHVLSDSQLMVRQMDGSYRVKERSLQQLFSKP